MNVASKGIAAILIIALSACTQKSDHPNQSGFRENIQFNHLFVVVDDSTYKYLFDSLKLLEPFAKIREETVNTANESWTAKYIYGLSNYLEVFKPGSIKGSKAGELGLGFITNKFGTIDSLKKYWATTLDSVHLENKTITDGGKITPWYTSVSIPKKGPLKLSAWVFENAKEEMKYAGFTETDLTRKIGYAEYYRHLRAKFQKVPIDSIKNDRLFDKVISLNIRLPEKEFSYLKRFLLDIGFTEKGYSFSKEEFTINYSLNQSERFLLKGIDFSLSKKVPFKKYSTKTMELVMDGNGAKMTFKY
jgi:hypothetical protein